jgi:hypothetical protein
MKTTSKISKGIFLAAVLAGLMAVGAGSAFAQQVYRNTASTGPLTFTDVCPGGTGCSNWGESVSLSETTPLVPVVVTWSARYFVNTADVYYVGLNVNGNGCTTGYFGPENLDDIATNPAGHFLTATFQWIIEPGDGVLVTGKNTFELCGGGDGNAKDDSINISQNTLTVVKN